MESCASECTNSHDQLDFVVAPPLDRFCPVCTELLTEPFLSDCGHHVCRECHKRIMATRKTKCPTCQEPNVLKTARLNKHLQREIYDLKIHCQNRKTGNKRGCQWIGELRELEDHLNPAKKRCEYILLVCSFGCGEQVLSGDMKDHKKLHCPKRQEKCKHCDYYNSRDVVMKNHLPVCFEFPVGCPNMCREKSLKRRQLKAHINECPLQVIECPFSSAGCTVKLPRNQMEMHEDTAMRQHLRIVAKQVDSLQESSAPATLAPVVRPQLIYNIPPVGFIMTGFLEKKQADKVWTSPPYYTHIGGYKFCLEVYPNGDGSGKGTHLSVYARLMEGEHDDELEWPFEGRITVKLLNQKTNNRHYRRLFVFNGQTNRVGFTEFISHTDLSYNPTTNTEYLQDDCLRLRVATIARIVSVSEFTEFSEHKQFFKIYNSQSFYTHTKGYKMCLQVKANGSGNGLGTHMSVYATLMRGEHDQHLQWPFTGELIIEVLNWREDKGHHLMILPIISDYGFVRVTGQQKYGMSRGWPQFISHSSLPYNPTTNTEYLRDDCLRLRVSVTKINC